jgi:hypothetical protein
MGVYQGWTGSLGRSYQCMLVMGPSRQSCVVNRRLRHRTVPADIGDKKLDLVSDKVDASKKCHTLLPGHDY